MNTAVRKAMTSSVKQDWETPDELFRELDAEFGFTLDVCASAENAKVVPFFDKALDGLEQDWGTNICWCNPPYGREQRKWVLKAYMASLSGATVVCLLPARPDTKIFHEIIKPYGEIRFLQGRLTFKGAKSPAPFPSMVVVFRPRSAA